MNILVEGELSIRLELILPLVNFTYQNNNRWLDLGADIHICFDKLKFKSYQNSSGKKHDTRK